MKNKIKIILVLVFGAICGFSTSTFAQVSPVCQYPHFPEFQATFGVCGFYTVCLEMRVSCGQEGYANGYGQKYCKRFAAKTDLSNQGIRWRDEALKCLQRRLTPLVMRPIVSPVTCEEVMELAFDTHPLCYLDPSMGQGLAPSICDLPVQDIGNIVSTVDASDALSLRSARQIAGVASRCANTLAYLIQDIHHAILANYLSDELLLLKLKELGLEGNLVEAKIEIEKRQALWNEIFQDFQEKD